MHIKGYYSLVRFVPDAFRGEGVNLGVLLLCPDQQFLDWRFTTNHQRARRFFRYEADAERLRVLERGLSKRLEEERRNLLDQRRLGDFVSRHQDVLQMTDLRTSAVSDPQAELSRLFSRLVEPEEGAAGIRQAMNAHQVRMYTASKLQAAGVLPKLQTDVELPARYRTSPYRFTFGYQNGGPYKLIHTTSFAYKEPNEGCERALVLLGEIDDVITHQSGHRVAFDVVAAFDPQQPNVQKAVSTAFAEKKVQLWVPEKIDPLIAKVKTEIH
jgi:hypothetical protein